MKPILDATAGSRSMWFDKENPLAVFTDERRAEYTQCDGRSLSVQPDIEAESNRLTEKEKLAIVVRNI